MVKTMSVYHSLWYLNDSIGYFQLPLHNVRFCQFSLSLDLGRSFISKHMVFLIEIPSFRCYCIKKIRKTLLANDFLWIWDIKDVWLTPKWWRKPLFFPNSFFCIFIFLLKIPLLFHFFTYKHILYLILKIFW